MVGREVGNRERKEKGKREKKRKRKHFRKFSVYFKTIVIHPG